MQFVRNGPDIPERLLQAHEEGRVIFFCGAGISYPARLPGFAGLVKALYSQLSVTPNMVQQFAIKSGQFDTAIGLLESDIVHGRETVRRTLASILEPDLSNPKATATHEALLILSENRNGHTRLITTNFDRLFEEVKQKKSLLFPEFKAPLLPIPKRRWNGLVYLHGLIPDSPTLGDLDRLVLSSGDFGLAYLTERWAARFVSELFRNFTVCFVGYSINDPVLRYMMDALAADRLLGESPPEMFAFGSYSKGNELERANEWRAKNVTPILYREHRHHEYMHKTLRVWAQTYQEGSRGKERIVGECAIARPLASTKQDDFVGRMLWALSDPGGLPAKRFAELDPVPSIEWLEPLSQELYRHADLSRFGVPCQAVEDLTLSYSLTSRPTPYSLAPWMTIVKPRGSNRWDAVMHQLAGWLIRHLNDKKLFIWLIKRDGQLHAQFIKLIERRLDEIDKFATTGNDAELDRIRASAPNAIPSQAMRILWRLLMNGQVKSKEVEQDIYLWWGKFKRDGLTSSIRFALRESLRPCISLREPFRWSGGEVAEKEGQESIKSIVEWELVLASDHVHSGLHDLLKREDWEEVLPELLMDFSGLLRDALDLMAELGAADKKSDNSYFYQPSIAKHSQNTDFYEWTALIELTRDAWLATAQKSPSRARKVAYLWVCEPYPIFRRLALFAATHDTVIPVTEALEWMLDDDNWWLWSEETARETMRLLISLAPRLDGAMGDELEQAILKGPHRDLYRADIEPDSLKEISDHDVWLRLAKAAQSGLNLSEAGRLRLETLTAQYSWHLAEDESDEFPIWTGGVYDDGPWRKGFTVIPRTRRGVLEYLAANPVLDNSQQDDWRKRCSQTFQATAFALFRLSQKNVWPIERWRDALQAWAEDDLRKDAWHYMAPVVASAPDELVSTLSNGISWWLQSIAKIFEEHEDCFLKLAIRILRLNLDDDSSAEDPIFQAINHPVGHVTQALLDFWYRQVPNDGQGLPEAIKPIFTELCNTKINKFRHGRLLLAAHALSLFRVDEAWAQLNLLPLLDWSSSEKEARGAWSGFLWSPRIYPPLMEAIKHNFLETVNHYQSLGKCKEQFAAFMTFVALDPGETFTTAQMTTAIRALPAEGLRLSASTLVRALEGAGDQREDYWKNRIFPFWMKIWPRSNHQATTPSAESLVRLCIAAGNEFPSALATVRSWLRTVKYPDYVIRKLHESGLIALFPEDALLLLFEILSDQLPWLPRELRQCLDAIGDAAPGLRQDYRYIRLDEMARRAGI